MAKVKPPGRHPRAIVSMYLWILVRCCVATGAGCPVPGTLTAGKLFA